MAQASNYSCAALRNDLVYLERTHQGSEALDDDCAENKRTCLNTIRELKK
jgi:hypothetical protein